MSVLAHILTSHIVQAKGCTLHRDNPCNPVTAEGGRYVIGGACDTLIIPPTMYGATNIYELVEKWLADNSHCSAPLVGVWVDSDNDSVHVDMSTLSLLRSVALMRARERGEMAIWDIADSVTIPVPDGMTWRELATEISSLPAAVMDSPAMVFSSDKFIRAESLSPYNIDEPISIINPVSIDLKEDN